MPDIVCVFGGDHIYRMDISQMIDYHNDKKADVTIAAIPVPVEKASDFGVIEVDRDFHIIGWEEKPKKPKEMPTRPGYALCSMGNYVFDRTILINELENDAVNASSKHDFGHNVIPGMMKSGRRVYAYDFYTNEVPGVDHHEEQGYWRDVGDIDSYWEANMDLVNVTPIFNLYNSEWRTRTHSYQAPPAKFVFNQEERRGAATDSIVADGCIISGGLLHRCVLSPYVRINSYSQIEDSILMHGVNVGRHAIIKKAIIDKGVDIPPHTQIGVDHDEDRARGFTVSPGGVTVVSKNAVIAPSPKLAEMKK
jgi:glucose-1-phosphate adenylyltransferase